MQVLLPAVLLFDMNAMNLIPKVAFNTFGWGQLFYHSFHNISAQYPKQIYRLHKNTRICMSFKDFTFNLAD